MFAHGDDEKLNMLTLRQIGFADLLVLNKVDLVGPEHLEVIKEWANHHLKRVRIIEATRCDLPLEILLAVGRRTEVSELGEWGERTPRSQLVAPTLHVPRDTSGRHATPRDTKWSILLDFPNGVGGEPNIAELEVVSSGSCRIEPGITLFYAC